VVDDDYTLDEGVSMPDAYWRLPGGITVVVRVRAARIPTAALLAHAGEFLPASDIFGPRYLDLWALTHHDAYQAELTLQRLAFDTLIDAHPGTFTTVIGQCGPGCLWLALRLTRLTGQIADTLIAAHRP
jgi:hypothetical protein